MAGGSSEGLDKLKEANEPLRSVANCGVNVPWGVGPNHNDTNLQGFRFGKGFGSHRSWRSFQEFLGDWQVPKSTTKHKSSIDLFGKDQESFGR